MQFFAPQMFVVFFAIPAIVLLYLLSRRLWKKKLSLFGYLPTLQTKLMPSYRPRADRLRLFFILLALVFSTLALARPQWGEEKKKIQRKGVDVIFMLDTSLSMLAEDAKPNRFEKSKIEVKAILNELKGDRVGMIAFAGSSFLQSPLTLDYSAFVLFLDAIKVGYIPDSGTSLDKALHLAIKSFAQKEQKHKALIIFSDGEDHEGGIDESLDELKKAGIRVYTLGVGTPEGDPIPLKDDEGRKTGFKKDRQGQVVVTKLNRDLLEKIARETGGLYFPSTPSEDEVPIILKHMDNIEKKQFREQLITEKEDHYQLFLFMAFFFCVIEMLVRRVET